MSNKKIALITGATRGIGLAIAKELASNNFIIIGTGTSDILIGTSQTSGISSSIRG